MDVDILRAILNSYEDTENSTKLENYKDVSRETLLCSQSNVFNTLCSSLSNLLCYKISKEAYQRYSVRTLVLDILRKWCRTTSNFEHLQIFMAKENSLKFVINLLDKYLTDDILSDCYSDNVLISLINAVMHLTVENPSFMHHLERLLVRLSQLKSNGEIEECLRHALCTNLHLKLSTREEIYIIQKFKLIEEPLLDSFVYMFSDLNKEKRVENQINKELLNQLLELSAKSAFIFQLVFNFLKELLVQMQYAPAIIDFIELMLKRISIHCQNGGIDIVDLYPRKLRPCIILLRIKPEYHTIQTKEYILQVMKEIFTENKDALLILMSHFPEWLKFVVTYVTNNTKS